MMKNRFVSCVVSASMLLSCMAATVARAEDSAAFNSVSYEWTEDMNRGLAAVPISGGVYLSWRLQADEDNRFGSGSENVSFDIYRDGVKIATESNTTNYIDAGGTASSEYAVVKSGESIDSWNEAAIMMSSGGYIDIPLVLPESETITDSSDNSNTYSFAATDCSAGDVDGDGEYEIIVKFVSNELDVGSAGYSGTTRFNAYKLDGTRLWENDINLGRNVFSSAHTAQFLVYDFDGDGKAEMTVQTSLGSTDSTGQYVSRVSADSSISSLTDEENATADFREANNGRVTTGQEFLTVFDGETGEAIDTINYPTARYNISCWGKSDGGNRSLRFLADVAYLDGEKPYALYWRGYYNHSNGRTGIAGISFDGERLSVDYIFDTLKGQPGYTTGNELYAGEGNHNLTVADVDNDGKDEVISGAMCMEVDDNNALKPKWCTFRGHGDALHIGDYDPTHDGYEFFTVHEEGGTEEEGVTLDYGMSVIDAATGEIMFHQSNTKDTGRGMMANVGSGGYYQITGIGTYQCNGGVDFTAVNNGMGNNFRVFWDGDLYDELLNSTDITSWNGTNMTSIFSAGECASINGTKSNPSLQADLFGDWREEVVYPKTDGSALRVFTTTAETDYKIKSLMYDKVYRSGVAAEQTAYNQPPHIGFYLSADLFYGTMTDIELDTTNVKKKYYVGEKFDKSGLVVTGKYSDADDKTTTDYSVSGYDSMKVGEQTITVKYLTYSKTYTVEVIGEKDIKVENTKPTYKIGEEFDKSALTVKQVYNDDTEKTVSAYKISGFDSMKAGEQTLT
ncbi:MAG: bacterial Ig-like domain-containing protein, partial [Candidatus Ornithomonoglobus sp.]